MKIKDAARMLGITEQTLRYGLQIGAFPFGTAFKKSSNYTYVIYPEKFKEYVGGENE